MAENSGLKDLAARSPSPESAAAFIVGGASAPRLFAPPRRRRIRDESSALHCATHRTAISDTLDRCRTPAKKRTSGPTPSIDRNAASTRAEPKASGLKFLPPSGRRASCATPVPPWPPPDGSVPAAMRAILAHPRFRSPTIRGDAPCAALPARMIESGGFAWPTFPAVLGPGIASSPPTRMLVACDAFPWPLVRSLLERR